MKCSVLAAGLIAAVLVGFTGLVIGAGTAQFYGTDTTTRGHWHDGTGANRVYGNDGYWIIKDPSPGPWMSMPAYATAVAPVNNSLTYAGTDQGEDARYLLKPGSSTHENGIWYQNAGSVFTFDVALTAGKMCNVAVYCWDWDGSSHGLQIDVLDGDTSVVLNTQSVSDYGNGKYFVWVVSGHLKFRVSGLSSARPFASGLFFDPPPYPGLVNLPATNVLSTTAYLNGNLTSTGGSPTYVSVYWDTNDWTTNVTSWGTNYSFGMQTVTPLTHQVTGLSSNTPYWYAYFASNSTAGVWAQPSRRFKTQGDPPQVNNGVGPTDLQTFSVVLNGNLTTGGNARLLLRWGTDSSSWANTNDFGIREEGPASTNLTSLSRNTTYYYCWEATNSYGDGWSAVDTFKTLDELFISASTNMMAVQSNLFVDNMVAVTGPGVVLTLNPHPLYGTLVDYQFKNLRLKNGASIVCIGQTNSGTYDANGKGISLVSTVDVILEAGTKISADMQGFANTRGPGVGGTGWPGQSGGGYGGQGGEGEVGQIGGTTYGSYSQPTCLGSGGGRYESMWHYAGGAIKITAGGKVQVDGTVSANSQPSPQSFTGAGSGGSIWITAGTTFSGSGAVCANGGTNVNQSYNVGGGGGGRVAVYAATNAFGGTVSAFGGFRRWTGGTPGDGAAGTVFIKLASQTYGDLIVDNNNLSNTWVRGNGAARLGSTNDTGSFSFDNIVLKRAGNLEVAGTETVNVTQATVNHGQGDVSGKLTWTYGNGALALPSAYAVSNFTLALNNGTPAGLTDLVLTNGGQLSHSANLSAETYKLDLNLASLVVAAGCAVDGSGKGYAGGYGPGRGAAISALGGAGHGGVGGEPFGGPGAGGPTYGLALTPTNLGSGSVNTGLGTSPGGGAVKIVASGDVTVDGTITVESPGPAWGAHTDGAGSGGSIWIQAANLRGAATGRITANGANYTAEHYGSGGGGGGRIALVLGANNFSGAVTAYGGYPRVLTGGYASYYGSAGTIYRKTGSQTYGDLIVDNNGNALTGMRGNGAARLGPAADSGTYTFDNIILRNAGHLEVVGTETLNVTQNTVNNGLAATGGKLTWTYGNGTLALPAGYVVSNYTLMLNNGTPSGLTDLTLGTGGGLSHLANSTDETYRLNLSLSTLTVRSGGAVSAGGKGYSGRQGPGKGYVSPTTADAAGASYGGAGGLPHPYDGVWNVPVSPPTYGSLAWPTNMGSGGTGPTTPGGGSVKIVTTGELKVDGMVCADGAWTPYGENYDSPGSGGSIWLECAKLSGGTSGAVTASGGSDAADYYNMGGAGGGRIAIYTPDNSYSGLILADGGLPTRSAYAGGCGTILIKRPAQTYGTLIVNSTNLGPVTSSATKSVTPMAARLATTNDTATWVFDELVLTNGGRMEVVAGQTLDLSGTVVRGGGGTLVNNGTVKLPATFVISNCTFEVNNGAPLTGVQLLTVASNGVLSHTMNNTSEVYRLDLTVKNLTIEAGGQVSAYGKGYNEAYGPGTPQPQFGYNSLYIGASHGGIGKARNAIQPFGPASAPYGNALAPTNFGSGGTLWERERKRGGGAIKLTVQKTLRVDGEINADGMTWSPALAYGSAGAGGSIWLDVRRLDGSGRIHANGGVDTSTGDNSGGGGGRIAVGYAKSGSFVLPALGLYTNRETMSSNVTVKGGWPYPLVVTDGPEDGSIYIYPSIRPSEGGLFIIY